MRILGMIFLISLPATALAGPRSTLSLADSRVIAVPTMTKGAVEGKLVIMDKRKSSGEVKINELGEESLYTVSVDERGIVTVEGFEININKRGVESLSKIGNAFQGQVRTCINSPESPEFVQWDGTELDPLSDWARKACGVLGSPLVKAK